LATYLAEQWIARIEGYYLVPARAAASSGAGFAAGVLVVSSIDAIARVVVRYKRVGKRFKCFVQQNLAHFSSDEAADVLYEEFRNGLVHEGRVKRGAEFSPSSSMVIDCVDGVWRINPTLLVDEVSSALQALAADKGMRAAIGSAVVNDYRIELKALTT
jgi:hypothetical protein